MGCNKCNKKTCITKPYCDYNLSTSAEYVTMNKDLDCLGISRGKNVEEVLLGIDGYLCELDLLTSNVRVDNIGGGAKVYKGRDITNTILLRSIVSNNPKVVIQEDEEEINIDIDLEDIDISDSCQKGISLINSANNNIVRLKTLNSDTINIYEDNGCIHLEVNEQAGIPSYIVNNLYEGEEEKGTLSKPFKTIENALNKFKGTGSNNSPENSGATIVIQRGAKYIFKADFSYRNLNIVVEEGAEIEHNPDTTKWIADLDSLNNTRAILNIELKRNSRLELKSRGFRNKGSSGGTSQYKTINIYGEGVIEALGENNSSSSLFESNFNNENGYAMPSRQTFNIEGVDIRSDKRDIINVGGDSEVRFNRCKILHGYRNTILPLTVKSFYQKGGNVSFNNCEFFIGGTRRTTLFYLKNEYSTVCILRLYNSKFTYPQKIDNLFNNADSNNSAFLECIGTISEPSINSDITNLFNSATPWTSLIINDNQFPSGKVPTTVDLTRNNSISVVNWIGGKIKESVVKYDTHQQAINAGLEPGTKYLKKTTIDGVEAWTPVII